MTNTDTINATNERAARAHFDTYNAAIANGKTPAEAMAAAEAARLAVNKAGAR